MEYVSTRGSAPALDFEGATLAGLASDGGLYVPREWPRFSKEEIAAMAGLPAFGDLDPQIELSGHGRIDIDGLLPDPAGFGIGQKLRVGHAPVDLGRIGHRIGEPGRRLSDPAIGGP